jgi:hypothetical protein
MITLKAIISSTCGEQSAPELGRNHAAADPISAIGSEDPERRARDEMASTVEGVFLKPDVPSENCPSA